MIVDEYDQRVIFTPPKTGSIHLQYALRQYPSIYIVHGPNPAGYCDHHTIFIEVGHINYEKVVIVRHPLDRFYSLYKHYYQYDENPYNFDTFFNMIINDDKRLYWIYRYTISRYLRWGEYACFNTSESININYYWKLEFIDEYIERYYPRVKLNPKYDIQIDIPKLSDKQLSTFKGWASEDLRRFSYVM